MGEIILTLRKPLRYPIDGESLTTSTIAGKAADEVGKIRLWEGKTRIDLVDLFEVSGDARGDVDQLHVKLVGDMTSVRRIGYRNAAGTISIAGNAGMYLGEEMSGGKIIVNGDAASWLGQSMKGGIIEVHGNAGDYAGSSYRGSKEGMSGGTILIDGAAGNETGAWMRDGLIRIKKNAGVFTGVHMSGGTILVEGNCNTRAGAQMTGGKIIILGRIPNVLPSFSIDEKRANAKLGEEKIAGPFLVFAGDTNEKGTGKLFVSAINNSHLTVFEKYLDVLE